MLANCSLDPICNKYESFDTFFLIMVHLILKIAEENVEIRNLDLKENSLEILSQ